MNITTGFGYYIKDGLKIAKYELPLGDHPDLPKGTNFVEVKDRNELNGITLDQTPEELDQQKNDDLLQKIQDNRNAYIDALIAGDTKAQAVIAASQADLVAQGAAKGIAMAMPIKVN